MKVACLNLPYIRPIVRRYTCTYHAENFLLPPLELMYLSSIIKQEGGESFLIDAIAERLSIDKVNAQLNGFSPNCLISLLGIETFSEDLASLKKIKEANPQVYIICIGYYPSLFPEGSCKTIFAVS